MSEEKQYILRKPISLNEIGTANNILKYLVEFDEEQLHKQIHDIIFDDLRFSQEMNYSSIKTDEEPHAYAERKINEILGLIKGEQS